MCFKKHTVYLYISHIKLVALDTCLLAQLASYASKRIFTLLCRTALDLHFTLLYSIKVSYAYLQSYIGAYLSEPYAVTRTYLPPSSDSA